MRAHAHTHTPFLLCAEGLAWRKDRFSAPVRLSVFTSRSSWNTWSPPPTPPPTHTHTHKSPASPHLSAALSSLRLNATIKLFFYFIFFEKSCFFCTLKMAADDTATPSRDNVSPKLLGNDRRPTRTVGNQHTAALNPPGHFLYRVSVRIKDERASRRSSW